MIKNKKVLLMCKESYSRPMSFIAKELEKKGNKVAFFFITPPESTYVKCKLTQNTYYYIKEKFANNAFYSVRDITEKLIYNGNKEKVDYDYLKYVEKYYTNNKCLNLQILSSQFLTKYYHYRNFFCVIDNHLISLWLQLNYQLAERIFEQFSPDIILDLDSAELQRTIMNEICIAKKIPYITFEYGRFDSYVMPTFNLGNDIDSYFKRIFEEHLSNREKLEDGIDFVKEFRSKHKIMDKLYKNDITAKYEADSILKIIRKLIRIVVGILHDYTKNKKLFKKSHIHPVPLLSNPLERIKFHINTEFTRRKIYLNSDNVFVEPNSNENYVFMPLHLIPESSTFTKSPYYVNEAHIIEQISKSLPIGWYLYVKEHQAMAGERPLSFFKKISKLHNVKCVRLNYYNDPKPWIENSKGVITITGTSAFEAAMLGKRSIVFGPAFFSLIKGISVVNDYTMLPELISKMNDNIAEENFDSCAAYISTVKSVGTSINIKDLLKESLLVITNQKPETEHFKSMINQVVEFYNKAYELYRSE